MQFAYAQHRIYALILLSICVAGLIMAATRPPKCRSIMSIVASDERLDTLAQTLRNTQLEDLLVDQCLSFTFFAPTSEAIAGSEWPEMKKNDSLLIGSILYHLVPFHTNIPAASTELPTALGLDYRLYVQSRAQKSGPYKEPLGIVAPSREHYTKPSNVLDSTATCEGIVYVIDAVLRPPKDALQKKTVRHALWGLEAKAPRLSARKGRPSCERAQNVGQRIGAVDDAAWLGRGRIPSEVIPTSLEQALMVAKGAAQAHAEDDEEAESETEREVDAKREQDGAREYEREQNEEEAPAKEQEDESYARVQEHMGRAKRSQAAALKAAQRAYAAALQLESYTVSKSAADWLAASQAALEKVQEAFRQAHGPSDGQTGHMVTAARIAQLLSEAALAQKTALSMARSADSTTELMGLPGLLTNTSAGIQWEEAVAIAQEDCDKAFASLGSLTRFLRSQEQALQTEEHGVGGYVELAGSTNRRRPGGHGISKRRIGRQSQLDKRFAGRVDQIHAKPRTESPALAHDWRAGLSAIDRGEADAGHASRGTILKLQSSSRGGNYAESNGATGGQVSRASSSPREGGKHSTLNSGLERRNNT